MDAAPAADRYSERGGGNTGSSCRSSRSSRSSRRGVSEAVTVVFLLIITVVAVGFVAAYYLSSSGRVQVGAIQQAVKQGESAGQIIHVVYYLYSTTQGGYTEDFYVYNSGNVAADITQIYIVTNGQPTPWNPGDWSICVVQSGGTGGCGAHIEPGEIYRIQVANTPSQVTEIAMVTSSGGIIVLQAGSGGGSP